MSNRINLNRFYSGFTDFFVNAEPNSFQTIWNMTIEPDGSLKMRSGGVYDSQYATDLLASGKSKKLHSFLNSSHLIAFIKNKGYVIQPGASAWTEIVGPASGSVFQSGTTFTEAAKVITQEFRGEIYVVGTDTSASPQQYSYPMKIYKDNTSSNNVVRVLRAGLPKTEYFNSTNLATLLSSAITLANELRKQIYTHFGRGTVLINTADIDYTNDQFTLTDHGLKSSNSVFFTSSTAVPTGLVAGTVYYVVNETANTFKLAATPWGAAINITATGADDNIIITYHTNYTTLFTVSEANMDFTANTFTQASHGLVDGQAVTIGTTSQVPTGLTNANLYYIVSATTNTFKLSSTYGGSAIDISDSGSGGADTVVFKVAHLLLNNLTLSADATTEATLVSLTKDLMIAYMEHVPDGRVRGSGTSAYHVINTLSSGINKFFGNFNLPALENPETLLECIPILNILKTNWNLHVNAYDSASPDYMQHILQKDVATSAYIYQVDSNGNYLLGSTGSAENSAFGELDASGTITGFNLVSTLRGLFDIMNQHVEEVSGAATPGAHPALSKLDYGIASQSLLYSTSVSSINTFSFLLNFYKFIHSYNLHTINNANHNGAAVAGEISTYGSTFSQTDGIRTHLECLDLLTPADVTTITTALEDVATKLNTHISGGVRHQAAGGALLDYTSSYKFVTYTASSYTWGKYGYAFVYRNEYTKNDNTKIIDVSTPVYTSTRVLTSDFTLTSSLSNYAYPDASLYPRVKYLSPISTFTMPSTNNNPSTTAFIDVYRTTLNGTAYYKVTTLSNSATEYYDTLSDTDLVARGEQLYTTGDLPENDPPPKCNCFAIVNNCGWYGDYIEEVRSSTGTDVQNRYKNRFRQSIQNDIDSCPETFYGELQDDLIAIAGIKNIPLMLCTHSIYRVDGIFGEDGSGEALPVIISDRVGALSATGGVTVNDIHYFAGHDGFYACDGYVVKNISKHIRESYRTDVIGASGQIHAEYNKVRNRVVWTAGASNDIMYVLQLPLVSADFGGFTKWGNSSQFEAYTVAMHGNKLYRIGKSGHLFAHDDTQSAPATYDTYINVGGTVTSGFVAPINWRVRTSALSHTLLGDFKSNISATFVFRPSVHNLYGAGYYNGLFANARADNDLTNYDGTGATNLMAPIRYLGTSAATGLTSQKGLIKEKRYFGRSTSTKNSGIRTLYTQIDLCPPTIESETSTIYLGNSSDSGILVDVAAAVVTLQSLTWGAVLNKESQINDYYFYFGADGSDGPYQVTAFNSTTATLGSSPTTQGTGKSWVVKGQPKLQLPHLDSVIIDVDPGFKGGNPAPADGGGL